MCEIEFIYIRISIVNNPFKLPKSLVGIFLNYTQLVKESFSTRSKIKLNLNV